MTTPEHDPFGPLVDETDAADAAVTAAGTAGAEPAAAATSSGVPAVLVSSVPRQVLNAYKEQARQRGVLPTGLPPA